MTQPVRPMLLALILVVASIPLTGCGDDDDDAAAFLERFQLVFHLEHQLASLVAPRVAGRFGALIEDAHLLGVGTDHDRLPRQVRRNRVAVAIELDPRVGSDHRRNNFIRI